ncbi:GIY-YIG nuclease family protein [Streptococcus pluranimalium]
MTDIKAYMYVLECADGTLYTGYTTDVERRLSTHNAGKGAKYTRARLPVKLLYQESFPSKQEAQSAEAYFKQKTRQQKLDYIEKQSNLF